MTGVTALVLAGQRRGTDPMAAAAGVSHKALLPVAGVPMLLRVVSALRSAPGIARIVVSIEEAQRVLAGLEDVILRPAAPGPALSAAAVFEEFGAPLLITTADHALLTPAMVAHLLREAPEEASAVAALARRDTILAEFPETRRTWLRFRDGDFSGCNLFLLARPEAVQVLRFWQRLEQQRKRPTAMARMLGVVPLLRYALGWMTLRTGLDALGARCGTPVATVDMPFGAAALDVDKPDDLALVEARLGAAERQPAPRPG
ncbi:nucleotidyltransferase family protein (plasmid) [Roseomonas gilardii subsp. gilardii]|uniref:nucleotidyltransferase family protein n=1 Tax=Roseomonas gilardii TaxID=257708 RepID=UPI001FFB9B7E|nr:nucleotidyltransferase family protein [Roseomonas gilardii]UPG74657.1 nucleotidyltransferase family protein [Roseomonas gilardii subsp. gilardii]